MARKFGTAEHPPPDGRVRQSQALTNYAPGAMVDLLHDAVLVGGLDFWGKDSFAKRFDEPRLRRRLERQFPDLRHEKPFVMPPEGDERHPTRRCGIQVLEFPSWFVCQKPSCRKLVQVGPGCETKANRYVHDECKDYLVPVRFVMACISGQVLRGVKKPHDCPAFGKECTPQTPLGATMVSSEGACAAYFNFGREARGTSEARGERREARVWNDGHGGDAGERAAACTSES